MCGDYLNEYRKQDWFTPYMMRPQMREVIYTTPNASGTGTGRVSIRPGTVGAFSGPKPIVTCIDEVDELPQWRNLMQALGMSKSQPPDWSTLLLASTRTYVFGIMNRLTENAAEMRLRVRSWCVWDVMAPCPTKNASCPLWERCRHGEKCNNEQGYWEAADVIQKAAMADDHYWATQYECSKPARQGLVYWQFDESGAVGPNGEPGHVHEMWEYNPDLPVAISVDWGYTAPAAVNFYQWNGILAWQFDEINVQQQSDEEVIALIQARAAQWEARTGRRFNILHGWADPERPSGVRDLKRAFTRMKFYAAALTIEDRLTATRARLKNIRGHATIFFHPRCKATRREFNLYHHKPLNILQSDGTPQFEEDPVDADDHHMYALGNFCYGLRHLNNPGMAEAMARVTSPDKGPTKFPSDSHRTPADPRGFPKGF